MSMNKFNESGETKDNNNSSSSNTSMSNFCDKDGFMGWREKSLSQFVDKDGFLGWEGSDDDDDNDSSRNENNEDSTICDMTVFDNEDKNTENVLVKQMRRLSNLTASTRSESSDAAEVEDEYYSRPAIRINREDNVNIGDLRKELVANARRNSESDGTEGGGDRKGLPLLKKMRNGRKNSEQGERKLRSLSWVPKAK